MQVNLGLREKSKMYWPHKKIRQPVPNLIPFNSSAFSAKSLKLNLAVSLKPENGYALFATITRQLGPKIRTGKLWMRG